MKIRPFFYLSKLQDCMLKLIDKQYLISCGFKLVIYEGEEMLKCNYPFVYIYNEEGEILDLLSIEVLVQQENNQWIIRKCFTEGEQKDMFPFFFKDNSAKSLLEFHKLHYFNTEKGGE